MLRELLHEYDHAIESVPRGFEIDLRGVAFGLARALVEEMLACRAVRDVKLAGGTGECKIVVTLEGHEFSPEDSFADDDEDTEVFQRGPGQGGFTGHGILDTAMAVDEQTDPAWHLERDAAPASDPGPESTMQPVFTGETTSSRQSLSPVEQYGRALQFLEEGEPREAIKLLERAIKLDMRFARAVLALGKAYASTGDYNRARRAFRHLTELEPDDPEAQVLHAAAAVRCERLEDARKALARAIKLDPDYKQAYRYAAQLYDRLGEPEKARKFRARYQALKLRG